MASPGTSVHYTDGDGEGDGWIHEENSTYEATIIGVRNVEGTPTPFIMADVYDADGPNQPGHSRRYRIA